MDEQHKKGAQIIKYSQFPRTPTKITSTSDQPNLQKEPRSDIHYENNTTTTIPIRKRQKSSVTLTRFHR
ncbi:hypothetical protein LM601614_110054 [Listeria monocytogenes]|nr:hypothetical protein LM601614_110054 [Listeria monocytogenes]